jgi:cysteine-rich repeat protein
MTVVVAMASGRCRSPRTAMRAGRRRRSVVRGDDGRADDDGEGVCGDGNVDVGEGCDDGNDKEEDGCPSGVKGGARRRRRAETGSCGWGGGVRRREWGRMGDGCEADCVKTPAVCGNGTVEAGEGCDDGNEVEEDGCPSGAVGQCKAEATCGDGFVWGGMEGCDDGNEEEEDANARAGGRGSARRWRRAGTGLCGRGWRGAMMGMREGDACPSGAVGAVQGGGECGDGFVWAGMEDCDDGNVEDLDGCSNLCAPPRYVFITSGNGPNNNGNLGGIDGGGRVLPGLAAAAKLPGRTWRG